MSERRGPRAATLEPALHEARFARLVADLQALIRIPTVNPPGDEIAAARWMAEALTAGGLAPRIIEAFPGRGNVVARLRGDGSAGGPLLLLGHLDVVPADASRWSQDPFGGAIVDGYLYGRGAVDMKAMVATSLRVVLDLAEDARRAGADPASGLVPGLRRDVILAATADEETGGHEGIGWIVEHEPELLRAEACITEAGGVTVHAGPLRFYPLGVAEKGYHRVRIVVEGASGHASMPRADTAAVLGARIVERLAEPTPQRVTPLMARALRAVGARSGGATARRVERILAGGEDGLAAIDELCAEPERRALRALLRDTISPTLVTTGVKENVLPGRAEIVVDCRQLPGTTREAMLAELAERIGPELMTACRFETISHGEPVEQPLAHPLLDLMAEVLVAHDEGAIPLPFMAPFATDAKHTVRLGIPTYGFSPLRLAPDEPFLERFHGEDERVAIDALRFGYAVLTEVVGRYCR